MVVIVNRLKAFQVQKAAAKACDSLDFENKFVTNKMCLSDSQAYLVLVITFHA